MAGVPSAGSVSIGLVAGWSFPATVFDPLLRHLLREEVITLDWPGFAAGWLGSEGQEEVTAPSCPATWMGWSLGGALLLEAVRRHSLRPERLVLVQATPRFLAADGWPGVDLDDWQALRRAAERHPTRAAAAFRRRFGLSLDPSSDAGLADPEGLDWLARLDLRDTLVGIDVPVEIWLAPDDPLVPADWPRHLDLPAHVRVHRLERGGHAAWLDHPACLARSMLRSPAR